MLVQTLTFIILAGLAGLAEWVVGIGQDRADERVGIDDLGVGWLATLGECEAGRREVGESNRLDDQHPAESGSYLAALVGDGGQPRDGLGSACNPDVCMSA